MLESFGTLIAQLWVESSVEERAAVNRLFYILLSLILMSGEPGHIAVAGHAEAHFHADNQSRSDDSRGETVIQTARPCFHVTIVSDPADEVLCTETSQQVCVGDELAPEEVALAPIPKPPNKIMVCVS